MSHQGKISTLAKVPMVSSTTKAKWYFCESFLSLGKLAHRKSGFEGNSVKRARGGAAPAAASAARSWSSASMSSSRPLPKK